jgi:hypothetical protein
MKKTAILFFLGYWTAFCCLYGDGGLNVRKRELRIRKMLVYNLT